MDPILSSNSLPSLGLGCVTFGREIDRAASFAMMDHAFDRAITLFDTAAAYGGGASETIVGEWIADRGVRAEVLVATKVLPPYTPETIAASVTESLRRLRQPAVDLLFLHRWDESALQPQVLHALDALVQSGRVRRLGASNFSLAQLERAHRLQTEAGFARFRAYQTIHNYAVRSVDDAARALCARADIAIVGYSPLGAGFLTGKHVQGVQPGSRFDLIPGHQNVYFKDVARRRLARLQEVAARSGVPVTTLALAWALHQSPVATVLVGGRSPAHLDQALHAQTFNNPELLRELDHE